MSKGEELGLELCIVQSSTFTNHTEKELKRKTQID